MSALTQIRQKFTLEERVFYARDPGNLVLRHLGYTDQDKLKRVSKKILEKINALQRADIIRVFPRDRLDLVGGSPEALTSLPIRNMPDPMPPPKPHKFPALAVGWTRIRPRREDGCITWRLHVYKEELSSDKTAINKMAIYFSDHGLPSLAFVGIWGVEAACFPRQIPCTCFCCCSKRYACFPWDCLLKMALSCGSCCTSTLSVNDDSYKKNNQTNVSRLERDSFVYRYQGIPYIPIWRSQRELWDTNGELTQVSVAAIDPSYVREAREQTAADLARLDAAFIKNSRVDSKLV
jgi:hypothetical protein